MTRLGLQCQTPLGSYPLTLDPYPLHPQCCTTNKRTHILKWAVLTRGLCALVHRMCTWTDKAWFCHSTLLLYVLHSLVPELGSQMSPSWSYQILEKLKSSDAQLRKTRESFYIQRFNTKYKGMNKKSWSASCNQNFFFLLQIFLFSYENPK